MKAARVKKSFHARFSAKKRIYVYKILRGNMLDSFEVAGNGFGSTFAIDYFPLRIDFILSDPSFKILEHTNFTFPYSDHYPISSKFIIP